MNGFGLKLYADNLSPVCRPVMLLLAANNIEHEYIYINLREGNYYFDTIYCIISAR